MRRSMLAALALLLLAGPALAAPLGTSFSYQGQLLKAGSPYTGSADFLFRLYDDPSAGSQVGGDVSVAGLSVVGGLFNADLDFGAVFDGTALWLEIQVQTPGDGGYTTLAPRQALAASPYALHALSAPGGGSSQWGNSTNGIDYMGNVGIGALAAATTKLWVNGGTANVNPLVVSNNNTGWGALAVRNDAPGGYGIYDAWSDKHYFDGFLGLGVVSPTHPLEVSTLSYGHSGIKASAVGMHTPNEYQAAVLALGYNGTPGLTTPAMGLYASSEGSRAVWGTSVNDLGVVGDCQSTGNSGWLGGLTEGVFGLATTVNAYGGKFANSAPGGVALRSEGLAQIKTLQILGGADLAEPFDVAAVEGSAVEPGTVVIIDAARPGELRVSEQAYDERVAGVVSGANGLAPGMVMKAEGSDHGDGDHPVALTGRVWCKADASFGAIEPGDMLTTSPTAGHAMKAANAERRAGAVIGKAMTRLEAGRGLVLVLVSLQ